MIKNFKYNFIFIIFTFIWSIFFLIMFKIFPFFNYFINNNISVGNSILVSSLDNSDIVVGYRDGITLISWWDNSGIVVG